ncbi:RNA-directed DNA polymerase, eukaryota [Tanacetum coccineum]
MLKTYFDAISERVGGVFERGTDETRMIETQSSFKDVRSMLDEVFLPKMEVPTRWIKSIPIKVNVFAWKLYLDRLPTRSNLSRRNVSLPSLACPLCDHVLEDSSHLFFGCSVAKDIQKLICRWWNLDVHPYESYED